MERYMNIKIEEVDLKTRKIIGKYGEDLVYGYWIGFSNEYTSGYAYIVPYGRDNNRLEVGRELSVETSQHQISGLRKLQEIDLKYILKQRDQLGNYLVQGQIEYVLLDETGKVELISVLVRDCIFELDRSELSCNYIYKVGDWITFELQELVLYYMMMELCKVILPVLRLTMYLRGAARGGLVSK